MGLPLLADIDDVTVRAPELADGPAVQVGALLADASALVRAVAGKTWVDEHGDLTEMPDGVVGVVAAVVVRALRNPQGVTQETTGPFNVSYGPAAADRLFLTKAERRIVGGSSQKAFTVTTTAAPHASGPDWWTVLP